MSTESTPAPTRMSVGAAKDGRDCGIDGPGHHRSRSGPALGAGLAGRTPLRGISSGKEAGWQQSGVRVPVHRLQHVVGSGGAALADPGLGVLGLHRAAAAGQVQVQVVDCWRPGRPRTGRTPPRHPPQRLLAQMDVAAGDQRVECTSQVRRRQNPHRVHRDERGPYFPATATATARAPDSRPAPSARSLPRLCAPPPCGTVETPARS